MSLICDYVRVNPNWLQELTASPYCLAITRASHFVKFDYTENSDTKIPLVAEACGLTIDLNGLVPVCWEVPYMSLNCVLVWRDTEGFWQVSDRTNILSPKREKIVNEYGLNFSTLNPDYVHVYIIEPEGLYKTDRIEQKTGRFLTRKEEAVLGHEDPGNATPHGI